MRFILLGTSGYHPTDARHTMSVMFPELSLCIDAGSGMYRGITYLEGDEIDIMLSHSHLDHIQGLTHLFDWLRVRKLSRITVHAESEKIKAIEEHLFHPLIFPSRPPITFQALGETLKLESGVEAQPFPLSHPGGAVGFRLEAGGKSLAYVCDTATEPPASYIQAIQGVDVLVHECFLPDEDSARAAELGHSSTSAVAKVAQQARVERLILVHFSPMLTGEDPIGLSRARAIFPNTTLGQDLMEIQW